MKAKKQSKKEDISTDWELNLNEGWGAEIITEWNLELPEWLR